MPIVLLVDDDEVFREALSVVLETRYRVLTAANGTEAVAKARLERPAVVILDVMMDHLGEGFDVARRLRDDPDTAAIRIVMLTGVDRVFTMRMEPDEHAPVCDRYLEKPVNPDEILRVLDDVLDTTEHTELA